MHKTRYYDHLISQKAYSKGVSEKKPVDSSDM